MVYGGVALIYREGRHFCKCITHREVTMCTSKCTTPEQSWELCRRSLGRHIFERQFGNLSSRAVALLKLAFVAADFDTSASCMEEQGHKDHAHNIRRATSKVLEHKYELHNPKVVETIFQDFPLLDPRGIQ
jgi:hypothetical protein